jgi:hypothetical protein
MQQSSVSPMVAVVCVVGIPIPMALGNQLLVKEIMSVYKKLQEARILLQNTKLNKSGKNKFAGYEYFELADFLPAIQNICQDIGLCGVVSFDHNMAYLQINDTDDGTSIMFTSPMSSAALKGCHDVQNLGATISYLRRYLWVNCFEICEHDALDATTGSEPVKKSEAVTVSSVTSTVKEPSLTINAPAKTATVTVKPKNIVGESGGWQIVAPPKPSGDAKDWLDLVQTTALILLDLTTSEEDVMQIFKKNKVLFDTVKATDALFFKGMMAKFTERNKIFKKD